MCVEVDICRFSGGSSVRLYVGIKEGGGAIV